MSTYTGCEGESAPPARRWSMSTTTTAQTPIDEITSSQLLSTWRAPPMPPIPDSDADMASWRRRSLKRDSYMSQTLQIQPALAPAIRQNHRESVRASWIDASLRPQSTYMPMSSRARQLQQRVATNTDSSWPTDNQNPHNWTLWNKDFHVLVALLAAFAVSVSTSILALTTSESFPNTVALLPYALFPLGIAFAPLTSPMMELCGRRLALAVSLVLLTIFTLIAALVNIYAVILVMRCLAGFAASPVLAVSLAILLDVNAACQRTVPIVLFLTTIAAGTAAGPQIGVVVTRSQSAAWMYYTVLCILGVSLISICFVSETRKRTILQHNLDAGRPRPSISLLYQTSFRKFRLLLAQPVVLLSIACISSYAFTTFALLQAVPLIYQRQYLFNSISQGYAVLSIASGILLALLAFTTFHKFHYIPKRTKWENTFAAELEQTISAPPVRQSRRASGAPRKLKRNSVYRQSARIRSSSAVSLRRPSTAQTVQDVVPEALVEFTAELAAAIAEALNTMPGNEDRHISPERVWMLGSAMPTFEQVLDELELQFDFVLDRRILQAIYNARKEPDLSMHQTGSVTSLVVNGQAPILNEKVAATHHAATLAALEKSPVVTCTEITSYTNVETQSKSLQPENTIHQRPPGHWRLPLALPGTVIATAGLFVLAWTANPEIHWIVPVTGVAAFGLGSFLCSACVCLYLTDRFGADDVVVASTIAIGVSSLLACAASLITIPLYQGLGIGCATSVLGAISVLPWLAATLLMAASRRQQE